MLRLQVILPGLILSTVFVVVGCSSNDNKPKDAAIDKPPPDITSLKEASQLPESKIDAPQVVPKIKSITPSSGFADKSTPVTIIGENFQQGMAVYLDGSPLHGTVNVASTANATFSMPPNPSGPPYNPYTMTVQVMVKNSMSNLVKFRYILPTAMTSSFHGVILTASVDAMRYIASPVIEGKLSAAANDAGDAPEAEVGYGPVGSNPSTDNAWRWLPVPFSRKEGADSIFGGSVRFPLEGSFDLAFRFSIDGGKYWIFADKDDTDLAYNPAQAAKLKVGVPPPFYCLASEDCAPYPVRAVCDVPTKQCVECLSDTDCTTNAYSFGPKCDTTKKLCYCTADTECAKNPNGALCNGKPKGYCGCKDDKNCIAPKTCTENPPKSGFFYCS